MKWIHDFQLFLFDFDGLLVNTEHIHFQAYINMCAKRNFKLDWSLDEYLSIAHSGSEALKISIYAKFPKLYDLQPTWKVLYEEKKKSYKDLLLTGKIELMPGAFSLLEALKKENIRRCVVTNSFKEQTDYIRASNDILNTIPHWITREDYTKLKPDPESYLKAISLYGKKGDKKIKWFGMI